MSMNYTHPCIKCKVLYEDTEPDAYLCEKCKEEKKRIADEVDRKMAGRISKRAYSALQEYDNSPKVHGFVQVRL